MHLHFSYILLLLWSFFGAGIVDGYERQPNIVILLSDDLGWSDLGSYGGPVRTPSIDRLAEGGTRFTNFYSGAAVCSPSRAVLLTGKTNVRASIYSWINDYEQRSHLLESEVTLAELLKRNGYQTAHFGKWHLGLPSKRFPDKPTPKNHGFDYWFATGNNAQPSHENPVNFIRNGTPIGEMQGYACDLVAEDAISWLENRTDTEKPFFMNVWFHEPHAPLAAPRQLIEEYGERVDPAAVYSATIANTDHAIDRLVKKIHDVSDPKNTLIIYSSDNGSYRQDRVDNLRGVKGSNYEGGIRVPGIFYWPGQIAVNKVQSEPAGLVDILPTVCSVIGIDQLPVRVDGCDLGPLLWDSDNEDNKFRSTSFQRSQPLFWYLPLGGPAIAMREGPYNLIGFREGKLPKNKEAIDEVKSRIEKYLREKGIFEEETRGSTLASQLFEGFRDTDAERMRGQFIRLNQFDESWIQDLKQSRFNRFELYKLDDDPSQKTNIAIREPLVVARMKSKMLKLAHSVMDDAFDWSTDEPPPKVEPVSGIHRFESDYRSAFDAFVYLNRIPIEPEALEDQAGLASRIQSRLSNQEGRVLIKLPTTVSPRAYQGFKLAAGIGRDGETCFTCHRLPEMGDFRVNRKVPSLRNRNYSLSQLSRALDLAVHQGFSFSHNGENQLLAFLRTLDDMPATEFRSLILNATLFEPTGEPE